MDQEDVNLGICQALHEHGILDINANPENAASKRKEEIPVALVWQLYQKVNKDLAKSRDAHNKQVNELQRYVENVRQLSKERDRLTAEFDAENEALKRELSELKKEKANEDKQISELCQEKMPELIHKSRTNQISHLLGVRSNLLEKLSVTEKVKTKHSDLEKQLHDLRSEDSDLRNRMELAMCEMGGMANKLTSAIQERDRLKREVAQLNKTLAQVKGLPKQNVNDMEASTQIKALENSVSYYVGQIERLTMELDKSKTRARIKEAELMTELKEYKEMNAGQNEGDRQVSVPHQSVMMTSKYLQPSTQQQLHTKSKQLITEMEAALQSDSQLTEEREKRHQDELSKLETRIMELEATMKKNNENMTGPKISNMEYQELKAQYAEMDRQCKVAKAEEAETREKMLKTQRELAIMEAQFKQSERQLNTQSEISFGLKQRNDELELEIAKMINELQTSKEKQSHSVHDRKRFENEMQQNQEEIKELQEYISEMKHKHDKEIRDLKLSKQEATRPKSYVSSESKRVSELQVQLTETQTLLEIEKGKTFTAEEDRDTARLDFEAALKKKEELSQELDDLHMSNELLEHQLQMMSGKFEDVQGQKFVEDMSREQLEEVTNVMTVRLMNSFEKNHDIADKYNSLKQKHKTKIRKIRELLMMERQTAAEEIEKLELRVMLAESALQQELAWKQKAIDDVKQTEEEHRKAIAREDEARKNVEKSNLELHHALQKYQNLSDENKMLHSQLDYMEHQKREIELLVTKERRKKELNTLVNDLNLSGSLPKNLTEASTTSENLEKSGYSESPTAQFFTTRNLPPISSK